MDAFLRILVKIGGFIFGLLLLAFTSSETYQFLYAVTASAIIAGVGLVMFEGGFIYWATEFKKSAEGLFQMAIALIASILDFLCVVAAVSLRLGAVSTDILGPETGARIVVTAVLINLSARYAYDLAHPDNMRNIYERASEGLIMARTFLTFNAKAGEISEALADEMAADWTEDMSFRLRYRHKRLGGGQPAALPRPQGNQQVIQNGQVVTPARKPLFDLSRLFFRPKPQDATQAAPAATNPPTPSADNITEAYNALVERFQRSGWGLISPDDIAREFGLNRDQAAEVMENAHAAVFGPATAGASSNGQPGGNGANHPT